MTGRKVKNSDIATLLLSLIIITSSMFVLQLAGYTVFLWLQIVYCFFLILTTYKINIHKYPVINIIFIMLFVTGVFAITSSIPESYKRTAIIMPLMLLPLYFSSAYIGQIIGREPTITKRIVKLLKIAVAIQMSWFALQVLSYNVFHIDINKLIFVDSLHMVENASFIRNWSYYPSGLSWHSASLAPLFVLGIIIFDNIYVRIVIIIESLLCGNATTFIGVILCVALIVGHTLFFEKKHKINKKVIISFIILFILVPIALYKFNLIEMVTTGLSHLWNRLFGMERDESTIAHMTYFTDYFSILKRSSLVQIVFGYGYGCSGFPITQIYNRYAAHSNWSIECDIIDILVSRGIVGFIVHYYFLLKILIKGRKIDYRYFVFIAVILFQGFGYNIQFDYMLMIEIILFICVDKEINFFASDIALKNTYRSSGDGDLSK